MTNEAFDASINHKDSNEEDNDLIKLEHRHKIIWFNNLVDESPEHSPERLETIDEALALKLPHGVCRVAYFDRNFEKREVVKANFSDNLTFIIIAIRFGIDKVSGFARVGTEA